MPKAYASTVLNAPAKEVWALIRDFNALPAWHPAITDSEIEEGKAGIRSVPCAASISRTARTCASAC